MDRLLLKAMKIRGRGNQAAELLFLGNALRTTRSTLDRARDHQLVGRDRRARRFGYDYERAKAEANEEMVTCPLPGTRHRRR